MNAEHVEDLLDLEALGALDAAESAFVRAHAAACPACRASLAAAEDVAARLALLAPMHRAPAALRGRVLAAVAADERASASRNVVPFAARGPSAIMRFNRKWGTMAAVLFLAPVAGLLTWAYVLQNQVNDLKEQNQQISDQQRDLVLINAGPTLVRARFTPTDAAGEAVGQVTWSPEDGVCAVSVRRLPRLEGGANYHVFYQGWKGVVDAGELRPDAEGAAALVFDASKWKGDTYDVWVAAVKSGAEEAPVLLQASLRRE